MEWVMWRTSLLPETLMSSVLLTCTTTKPTIFRYMSFHACCYEVMTSRHEHALNFELNGFSNDFKDILIYVLFHSFNVFILRPHCKKKLERNNKIYLIRIREINKIREGMIFFNGNYHLIYYSTVKWLVLIGQKVLMSLFWNISISIVTAKQRTLYSSCYLAHDLSNKWIKICHWLFSYDSISTNVWFSA